MRSILVICLFFLGLSMHGQTNLPPQSFHKGHFYVYWGYNRTYYNRSDVHFKGEGYDFTLERAWAQDIPEKFDPKVYFNPTQLTVPQFNFRVGYFFRNQIALSFGWDHMKYQLVPTQFIRIDGYIDPVKYPLEGYNGTFHHEYLLYQPGFMNYHHSDGFNFVRMGLEKYSDIWQSRSQKIHATLHGGCNIGFMLPWTDFTFFGEHYENKPHISGFGISVNAGARISFWKHLFIQINAQVGWSQMGDILLQHPDDARATQKISFVERSWALGTYFNLNRKHTNVKQD
jgi:hypothetical protein